MTFTEKAKRFLEPYKQAKVDIIFFMIRVGTFTFFGTILMSYLLSQVTLLLTNRNITGFESLIIGFSISLIAYYILVIFIRHTGLPQMRAKVWIFIHRKYIKMTCELDNNYAESLGSARIFSIIDKGGQAWAEALKTLFQESTRLIVIVTPTIFLLSKQSGEIALVFISVIMVGGAVLYRLNKSLRKYKLIRAKAVLEYDRHFIRSIQSRHEITQSMSLEKNLELLDRCNEDYRKPYQKQTGIQMLMFQGSRVLSFVILATLYWILGHQYLENNITLSHLIFLASLTGILNGLFFDITELYMNLSDQIVSIEQLWEKLDAAPKTRNLFSGETFLFHKGEIHFKNIHFSYHKNSPIFENFSYTFHAGKKYALVGSSGGGKTTLMKLASGFLSAQSGTVSIDNFDLTEVNLSTLYPHIGYLTQDPGVFDATIRENLMSAYKHDNSGKDDEKDLIRALKLAHCDFVFELEKGLDTEIGERGVRLSGGQKQRLAIAKIFLKNPEIILLDEPTSALDSFSEEKITEALDELFQGRTVIIVAHRLQTVKKADEIIVLDGGQIAERGRHEELLEKKGIYSKMLELQSGF